MGMGMGTHADADALPPPPFRRPVSRGLGALLLSTISLPGATLRLFPPLPRVPSASSDGGGGGGSSSRGTRTWVPRRPGCSASRPRAWCRSRASDSLQVVAGCLALSLFEEASCSGRSEPLGSMAFLPAYPRPRSRLRQDGSEAGGWGSERRRNQGARRGKGTAGFRGPGAGLRERTLLSVWARRRRERRWLLKSPSFPLRRWRGERAAGRAAAGRAGAGEARGRG